MKSRAGQLLAVLLLCLTGWWLWPRSIKNLRPNPGPIVVLGDSLSAGVGSDSGQGFVAQLQARLGVELVNRGVPGDTTAGGLSRLEKDVLALKPVLVVVELGGNDFMRDVPMEQTFGNLDSIVSRVQDTGAAVLLLGVQNGPFSDKAHARYKELAWRRGTGFVPNIMSGILTRPDLKADYIHPNDAGYKLLADRVEPELRWMLKRLRP